MIFLPFLYQLQLFPARMRTFYLPTMQQSVTIFSEVYNITFTLHFLPRPLLKCSWHVGRDVAAAPQTPQLGRGGRPTLGAQVSLKLLFGYVTIFSSADLFTTDLNCRKKLTCDIISECYVILSRRILNIRLT